MATWKWESGQEADGVDAEESADTQAPREDGSQPLFGKFRRASMGDGRAGSMAEMWGFGGEERAREERRKRFWGAPESDARVDMEDDQPWLQFRKSDNSAQPGVVDESAAAEEAWAVEEYADDPGQYEPEPAPPSSGRGWQNFLVDGMRAEPSIDGPANPNRAAASFVAPRREPVAPPRVMPLMVETSVDLRIAVGLCTALSRDWRTIEPTVADVVIRSLARAIRKEPTLSGHDDTLGVMDIGSETGIGCLLEAPASRSFKEVVGYLAESPSEQVGPALAGFTDYGLVGIERATPRLGEGQLLSLALGARTFKPAQQGESFDWAPFANLTLAYDGNQVSDGAAARVLARVRHLIETPEELLAH